MATNQEEVKQTRALESIAKSVAQLAKGLETINSNFVAFAKQLNEKVAEDQKGKDEKDANVPPVS